MSTELLDRPGHSSEALLSDPLYPRYPFNQRARRRAPASPITMEAPSPFRIRFGNRGAFILEHEPDKWFMPLLNQVCELGLLLPNWDTYGAKPIDPNTASLAVNLMLVLLSEGTPMPSIVPTSHGGIQLEWHDGGIDLEVDIRSPSSIDVLFADGEYEEEVERAEFDFVKEKLGILQTRLLGTDENV